MRKAVMGGIGMTPFGTFLERNLKSLSEEAVSLALKNARSTGQAQTKPESSVPLRVPVVQNVVGLAGGITKKKPRHSRAGAKDLPRYRQ